mmetsp:Transcript_76860/g.112545  ORF Transcript_76860/g.112545 Transcript_76860/m.112545 type:complete len:98 (+) Transcript_76860:383-676(+)
MLIPVSLRPSQPTTGDRMVESSVGDARVLIRNDDSILDALSHLCCHIKTWVMSRGDCPSSLAISGRGMWWLALVMSPSFVMSPLLQRTSNVSWRQLL